MSSQNKKNKEKNCNSYHGFALKEKNMKLKRLLFFNSSKRKELKNISLEDDEEMIDISEKIEQEEINEDLYLDKYKK